MCPEYASHVRKGKRDLKAKNRAANDGEDAVFVVPEGTQLLYLERMSRDAPDRLVSFSRTPEQGVIVGLLSPAFGVDGKYLRFENLSDLAANVGVDNLIDVGVVDLYSCLNLKCAQGCKGSKMCILRDATNCSDTEVMYGLNLVVVYPVTCGQVFYNLVRVLRDLKRIPTVMSYSADISHQHPNVLAVWKRAEEASCKRIYTLAVRCLVRWWRNVLRRRI